MVFRGLLPSKRPIKQDSFTANNVQQQFNDILDTLRSFNGAGLARGAVGLPGPSIPATIVTLKQDGTMSWLLPDSVQHNPASVIKQLDAQLFQFVQGRTFVTGTSVIYRTQIAPQSYETFAVRIPHMLGRVPRGAIIIAGS